MSRDEWRTRSPGQVAREVWPGRLSEWRSHAARYEQLQRRLDHIYRDKLDGKIAEDFWREKHDAWHKEQEEVRAALHTLCPTYHKPFQLLRDALKTEEWSEGALG